MTISLQDLKRIGDPRSQDIPWVLPNKHVSASFLAMVERCPEQARHRYILGEKERPGEALVLGTAEWGAQVEGNYRQKIESHEDVPEPELLSYYDDKAWPDAIESKGGASEIQWNGTAEDARTMGRNMVQAYRRLVAPRIQPIAVEQEFKTHLAPDVPIPLLAYVDLITEQKTREHKTSKRKVLKPKSDWRFQGRIYRALTGKGLEWEVVVKNKTPAVYTALDSEDLYIPYSELESRQTVQMISRTAWTANYFMHVFGPDEPWPTWGLGDNWACDWCGFRSRCPAWQT